MTLHTVISYEDIFFDFPKENLQESHNKPPSTNPTDYLNKLEIKNDFDFKSITMLDDKILF